MSSRVAPEITISPSGALATQRPEKMKERERNVMMTVSTVLLGERTYAAANGKLFDEIACLTKPEACIPGFAADGAPFLDPTYAWLEPRLGYVRKFHAGPKADQRMELPAIGEQGTSREHADDHVRPPVQCDGSVENGRLAAKAPNPQVMADDHHLMSTRRIFVGPECPPELGLHAEEREERSRDARSFDMFRYPLPRQIETSSNGRADLFKDAVLNLDVEILAERKPILLHIQPRRAIPEEPLPARFRGPTHSMRAMKRPGKGPVSGRGEPASVRAPSTLQSSNVRGLETAPTIPAHSCPLAERSSL